MLSSRFINIFFLYLIVNMCVFLFLTFELHIPPELHADSDSICMKVSGGTAYLSV